jgi:hypothetical protein
VFRLLATLLLLCAFGSPLQGTTAAVDHPGSLPILLGTDKVRAQLRLDSLQRALLDSLRDEYKSSVRELTNVMPASEQERLLAEKKLRQLNDRYNRRALSMLSHDQRAKLLAMERKFLGATIIYTPSVQAKLDLTEQQKKQVEGIRQRGLVYVGKINRKFQQGKISQQQRIQLLRNRRTAQGREILDVLTPKQREVMLVLGGKKAQS